MQNTDETNAKLPSDQSSESCTESSLSFDQLQFPAYILCGGQSVRFGTDKARVRIDHQPHLLRLAKSLRNQGHETHFVADSIDRYKDLGIATIVDVQPKSGPMSGLIAAAKHRASYYGSGWFLLLSCDQLRWQPKYFHWLASHVRANLDAITYRDPRIQPIPGLYHTRIETAAEKALVVNQLSLKHMLESSKAAVSIDENENPRDWCFNSQAELNSLLDKLEQEFEL